jgi:myo-inositol-1-phosphate synthase
MEVWDAPGSAGVVIDAVRYCTLPLIARIRLRQALGGSARVVETV